MSRTDTSEKRKEDFIYVSLNIYLCVRLYIMHLISSNTPKSHCSVRFLCFFLSALAITSNRNFFRPEKMPTGIFCNDTLMVSPKTEKFLERFTNQKLAKLEVRQMVLFLRTLQAYKQIKELLLQFEWSNGRSFLTVSPL